VARIAIPAFLLSLVPAAALSAAPGRTTPVITWAPERVAYGDTAKISGRLRNASPGDEVTLQARRPDSGWYGVASKEVGSDGAVRFSRHDSKRSTSYKLVYTDEVAGTKVGSDPVRVHVKPRLALRVAPGDTYRGREVKITGSLLPKVPNRTVLLQKRVGGEWRKITRTAVAEGRFKASFRAKHLGTRKVRARFGGDGLSTKARHTTALTVYRSDAATWYGPGLYGNTTACGKTFTPETLGVAHRTLPCGTMVSILYRGRSVTVPVVDRGPYSHANWDLTNETAQRLRFSGSDNVGVTR
jgi:hypothetical protein